MTKKGVDSITGAKTLVEAVEGGLNGGPEDGQVFQFTMTGVFGETGRVMFVRSFDFHFSIQKADCDLIVANRFQRFIAEEYDSRSSALTLRPDLGWCPVLVASTDTVELRGRPGATFALAVFATKSDLADRVPRVERVSLSDVIDGVLDCTPHLEPRPLEQQFAKEAKKARKQKK